MTEVSTASEKERPIRRMLRHKHSQEYFTGGGWTKNPESARSFRDSLEAAQTCALHGLSGVEMVLRIKGGTADLYCREFS